MQLSEEKSSKGARSIQDGIDFLGINICPGAIRPGAKARAKILASVREQFESSLKAMRGLRNGQPLETRYTLVNTLKRVDGMISGWGKHYFFCNDEQIFANIDKDLDELMKWYLGGYASLRDQMDLKFRRTILGISELARIPRQPFSYPKTGKRLRT
jgi:hypothetical protein